MAKVQTRRSVSLSAAAFERAHAEAERHGVSLSKFTEQALDEAIRAAARKDDPEPTGGALATLLESPEIREATADFVAERVSDQSLTTGDIIPSPDLVASDDVRIEYDE